MAASASRINGVINKRRIEAAAWRRQQQGEEISSAYVRRAINGGSFGMRRRQ